MLCSMPSKFMTVHALVDHIGCDDAEWISKVKADMKRPVKERMIGDSLDELVLAELPQQEQKEFREVADEIDAWKKIGWTFVEQQWRAANSKTKPGPKAKAKGKSQGKGQTKFCLGSKEEKACM